MTAAEVADAGPDWLAGRALLEAMADKGAPFTANDIRPLLREYGFGRYTSGLLFRQAREDGVIRRVGIDVSSDKPSKGAFVRRWVGTQGRGLDVLIPRGETVAVPVQRDRRGQFAGAGPLFTDVPLPLEVTR